MVPGSTDPQIPRKQMTSNFIDIEKDLKQPNQREVVPRKDLDVPIAPAAQLQHDINALIAEMNANGEFVDKLSELSETGPEKIMQKSKSMYQHDQSSLGLQKGDDKNMINLIESDIDVLPISGDKKEVNLPSMTQRTANHPQSSSYYNNSETNYSTAKKQMTTFEELKAKYLKDAEEENVARVNEFKNSCSQMKNQEYNRQSDGKWMGS